MNFLPACPAERINLNYPTNDQHWPKFIRKLWDCHTKLKVWCHIKAVSWHCVPAARAALHGGSLRLERVAALQGINTTTPSAVCCPPVLLWAPSTLQSHSWGLTRAAECREGERQHPQSQLSGTTGCIHRHRALSSWNGSLWTTEHELGAGDQGPEETLNKLFTSSIPQKLRSSSVAVPFQNLILD